MSTGKGISEHDCGQDAAAYVLGALEREEATAFTRHMATCVVCRDEVATLQTVADALPMATPQVATPASLKRKVMTAVKTDARARRAEQGKGRLSFRPAFGRPALTLAGFAAALVLGIGALELVPSGSSGTRIVHASVSGGSGVATLRVSGDRAELTLKGMPPPPTGHIYEVWLKRGGQAPAPTSALFSVTSTGSAAVDVPGDLHDVHQVLVTPEPLGGSAVPTHAPVIVAQVPRL